MAKHTKLALTEGGSHPLYGASAEAALAALTEAVRPCLPAIIGQFYEDLSHMPGAEHLIGSLSAEELAHLKEKQAENLLLLCSPGLTAGQHQAVAWRVGRIHAICGLSREHLVHSLDTLYTILREYIDAASCGLGLSILNRRLIKDMGYQMHAAQQVQASWEKTLRRISELSWSAHNYIDLITQAAEILSGHDGVSGCIFLRPDRRNLLRAEAQAGAGVADVLDSIEKQQLAWLDAGESPLEYGPIEQAWRTGLIHRSLNSSMDEQVCAWRAAVQPLGIRSSVAIPLGSPSSKSVILVLALYCRLPGGLSSPDQASFLAQVQSLLNFGIGRLESWNGLAVAIPYATRRRWVDQLAGGGLEMYYQPVVDLRTGQTVKVEALARLHDGGRILAPGQFFPALSSGDFLMLYVNGLDQVLKQRADWLGRGLALDIAVNLPMAGLQDERYVMATGRALAEHGCPPDALTLEILESEEVPSGVNITEALRRYKSLGVNLAEDDLGSGYSSLARLREMPFDIIKIDRSIVSQTGRAPFDTLCFVYHLTSLGHGLGKTVIVEGVEDEDLLEALAILGVDCVQGHVIARPMPALALEDWIVRQVPGAARQPHFASIQSWLAKLLIWEEDMRALLDKERDPSSRRSLVRAMCGALAALPLAASSAARLVAELGASVTASGLRSPAYLTARSRMIDALLQSRGI